MCPVPVPALLWSEPGASEPLFVERSTTETIDMGTEEARSDSGLSREHPFRAHGRAKCKLMANFSTERVRPCMFIVWTLA